MRRAVLFLAALGCSGKREQPRPQPGPGSGGQTVTHGDAGTNGTHTIQSNDPASGMHLDDDAAPHLPPPIVARTGHPIDVTLRSTPTGAHAIVDGMFVGDTPAFWSGAADGREHVFTFTMPGHSLAQYRFVPVASGVIHARLDEIADDADAGVPVEIAPNPPTPPPVVPALAPVAPPPTVITPVDGAPVAISPVDAVTAPLAHPDPLGPPP